MVRKTQTTSFGSVVRESHSSKKFYSSKLFKDFEVPKSIDFKENAIDGAGYIVNPAKTWMKFPMTVFI